MAMMMMMVFQLAFRRPEMTLSLLLLVLLQATYALAADCLPPPLLLPIDNVTLSNGATQRGVFLGVGEPEQKLAFLPNWHNNNTFVYGPDCDSVNIAGTGNECLTYRGGIYKPDSSSAAVSPTLQSPSEPWPTSTYKFLNDTLHLTSDVTVKNFVFANPVNVTKWDLQAYDPLNIIGMDKGSTLMSKLQSRKQLASSTFGWWWGLDGVDSGDQQPGSFVLGGYDKAKTFGDGVTIPMTPRSDCPTSMMVTISDIILNKATGVDVSIFSRDNGGTVLVACIIPERPSVMDMPRNPYFSNLLNAISNDEADRSTGIDWWNVILDRSETIYNGDMTFVLNNGLKIKVDNHQLVVPDRKIDSSGKIYTNGSRPVIRINSLQSTTANVLPVLGRYFLTAAYLMGNPAAGQFTLWQANPTSAKTLVAVGDDGKVYDNTQFCPTIDDSTPTPPVGSGNSSSSSSPSSDSKTTRTDSSSSKTSAGTIAGAAVGAVAGVAGVAGLIWFFLRKRRREAAYKQAVNDHVEQGPSAPKYPHEMAYSPPQGTPHVYSPEPIPQEMATTENRDTMIEMPG